MKPPLLQRALARSIVPLLVTAAGVKAANYTWDTVAGDGAAITAGSGTWDTTSGNLTWNDGTTPNVAWANGNTPIFAGADGTYSIDVGAGISAAGLRFTSSGYTLAAASPTTLALTGDLSVSPGKIATIGPNLTVTRGPAPTITGGGTLNILGTYLGNGASNAQITGGTTVNVQAGGSLGNNLALVIGTLTTSGANNNGTLNISGGAVTTTGLANVVLGNLVGAGTSSTAVITIDAGSLSVSPTATNGIRFGSTSQSSGTITGTFNLNGGVVTTPAVSRTNPTATGVINSIFTLNGGILRAAKNNPTFFENIGTASVKAGGAHIDTNNFAITIAQPLLDGGGGGGLEKLGGGTLTLTGNNTYAGTTTITGGTLQVGNGGANGTIGNGPVVNNGALVVNRTGSFNLAGGSSGTGSVSLNGTATVTLGGTNTYTGTTSVNAGRLELTGTLASNVTIASGANLGGEGSTTGTLTFTGTNSLFFDPATAARLQAASVNATGATITLGLSGSTVAGTGIVIIDAPGGIQGTAGVGGNFQFTGRGVTYLNNNSTQLLFDYAPATLTWVGNDPTNPTSWDSLTSNWLNGATPDKFVTGDAVVFDDTASSFTVNVQAPSPEPRLMTFQNATKTYTLQGAAVAGSGSLVKNGANLLIVTNANTYTGGSTINAGTVQLGDGQSATGDLGNGPILNNASLVLNYGSNNATIVSEMRGNGLLTQSGIGTVSFTGPGTFTGSTVISNGTLQIGEGGTTGQLGTGPIANEAILALNRSDNFTLANVISGAGTVSKLGAGTAALSGANTYSGSTFISGGAILIATTGTPLGDTTNGTTVSGTGAALQLQGDVTVTGEALTLAGDGVNGTTAAGALRSLSGNNEWAGSITVTPAATTRVVIDTGRLKISGPVSLSPNPSDQFVLQGAGDGEISGVISGNSRVTRSVTGAGVWTLSGANTFTGKTTISNGTIRASSLNSINGGTPLLPSSSLGAPLDFFSGTIDLGGTSGATVVSGTLVYTGGGETTDRVINLPSSAGNGTLDQSGTGVLKFTSDLGAGPGAKSLILQGSTAGTGEFAGGIGNGSGTISVVKAGTGTWKLNGSNFYTGPTNITAGTLAIGVSGSLSGTTAVNISPDATLDITELPIGFTLGFSQSLTGGAGAVPGKVKGPFFAADGATIAPGAAAGMAGQLEFSLGLGIDAGSHLALDLNGTAPGTGYDQLLVRSGSVSLSGDLLGSTLTFAPRNFADVFYIIVNSGAGLTSGTLGGIAEGGSLFLGAQEFRVSYTSDFGGAGFAINGSGNDVALLAVPEPATTATLLLALPLLLNARRRRVRDARRSGPTHSHHLKTLALALHSNSAMILPCL